MSAVVRTEGVITVFDSEVTANQKGWCDDEG